MRTPLHLAHVLMLTTTLPLVSPATTLANPERPVFLDPLATVRGAGELSLAVKRLSVVGSVLYVAAHPDDENTRLLSWLVGQRGLTASYVSLTRGDGGQNLIGSELGPLLGFIRTHELLAARRIDGARQYFTRAVDFGYSKSAEETLSLWHADDKDAVLQDLVRVVRVTRPDVIITRFSTEPPNHGHHTASALLAREAFDAAADPARFPRMRNDGPEPHAALRLFENKSHWRFKEGEDLSRYQALDVGTFSPLLGRSFAELAAASRTMHKSQGFGSAPTHGPQPEYFELVARRDGAQIGPGQDPLAGLDFTWRRFPGTDKLIAAIAKLDKAFTPERPAAAIPLLLAVRAELDKLPAASEAGLVAFYRNEKLAEVDQLLLSLSGLYLDARAKQAVAIPGEAAEVELTAWARTGGEVALTQLRWPDGRSEARADKLAAPLKVKASWTPPADTPYSTPFWLREPPRGHLFAAPSYAAIHPVGPADVAVRATVSFSDGKGQVPVDVVVPVQEAWVDPVHGERFRPVELLPPVTVTPGRAVLPLVRPGATSLSVSVKAHAAPRKGRVVVEVPTGWRVEGEGSFELAAGAEVPLTFAVTPEKNASGRFALTLAAEVGDRRYPVAERVIDHTHVPKTTILSPAVVTAVAFPFEPGVKRIGYIVGPGDEVMESLLAVGYDVTALTAAQLEREDLSRFDAIVAGVRAFNQEPTLKNRHARLMKYVQDGGTYLVQYQVSSRFRPLGDVPIGPLPFAIGQGRVTDERAAMKAIDPRHPALNSPNRLDGRDFDGWVQERGLYFAEKWDPGYVSIFEISDPGEEAQRGAVLVARHGKGVFIYTGLAFFRQLPDGVPGAYRLLANLLSLGRGK